MSENEKKDILSAEVDENQMGEVTGGLYDTVDSCDHPQPLICVHINRRNRTDCAGTVQFAERCVSIDGCRGVYIHYDPAHDDDFPDAMGGSGRSFGPEDVITGDGRHF